MLSHSVKTRRLLFGITLLVIVNVLWVASSEISKWLFSDQNFSNGYLATYLKTCLFMIYLLGFIFHRPWRDQCFNRHELARYAGRVKVPVDSDNNDEENESAEATSDELENNLSQPCYEPVNKGSDSSEISSIASISESEDRSGAKVGKRTRLVKFNRVKEVRKMPAFEAEAALLARLPHDAWMKVSRLLKQYHHKLSVRKVAELALQFTFVWFLGNYSYLEALKYTEAAVVNVLSSTSSLFTLVLAALLPSCPDDKLTLSKFCVVLLSILGICIVTYADKGSLEVGVPNGAVWSLVGSLSYALYLVLLRRRVDSEDKLDIPMFFGFVGLFNAVFMWPGLYILHVSGVESFYPLPNQTQFLYLMVNGIIGTVLSEYLWLCGCFLTSSLTATLSLGLSIPLTILADCLLRRTNYSLTFYLGFIPILLSLIFSSLLVHYDNWDPIYCLLRGTCSLCSFYPRLLYAKLWPYSKQNNSNLIRMKCKNSSDEIERLIGQS